MTYGARAAPCRLLPVSRANCRSLKARLSYPEPVASKGLLSLRLRGARSVSASLCGTGAPFLVAPSLGLDA